MPEWTIDLADLRSELGGKAVAPGEDGWDEARAAWNLAANQQPAAAVFAEGADDIAAAISFARSNDLRIAPQGTGHGARPGTAEGSILVKTERMNDVQVDAEGQVGRLEAGVIARDAGTAIGEHGLSAFPGSSADVGVVGYTLGGGLSWLGRRQGLACNNVRAIELVTADGELRRVDAGNDPDLFWALRGGGGSFAVVGAIEFDLVELPQAFAGAVVYPADERSGEILRRYFEWAAGVPDDVTSLARFVHPPPLPHVPEPLRDRHLIMLAACYAGPESEGAGLIAPLRELGEPVVESFRAMAPSELVSVAMDPEEPVPSISDTTSLAAMPDEAVDAFVETAGPDAGSPLVNAELRQLGGALSVPAEGAGARSHLDAAFAFSGTGVPISPELGEAINRQIDAIRDALAPWSGGHRLNNFAGRPTQPEQLFDPETLARLRDVKQRYDPDGLIGANLPLAA
jgi:FAD/FMN-containing dehydrogenase